MDGSDFNGGHAGPDCRCVIGPAWLREIRRRHMVSVDAVTAASGYHREHLTMVERGTSGVCVDRDLLHAYEKAIGVTATDALLAIVGELLGSLWSAHETLTRLHRPHQTTSTDR